MISTPGVNMRLYLDRVLTITMASILEVSTYVGTWVVRTTVMMAIIYVPDADVRRHLVITHHHNDECIPVIDVRRRPERVYLVPVVRRYRIIIESIWFIYA